MPCINPGNSGPTYFENEHQRDNETKVIDHIVSRYQMDHPRTGESMESWVCRTGLIHWTELDLSNLDLGFILPPIITKFTNLRKLNLDDNKIWILPDEFENLSQLEHISLRNNSFDEVPYVLTKLLQLNYLDISHNGVVDIKYAVEIEGLKTFKADKNKCNFHRDHGATCLHNLCHKLTEISLKDEELGPDYNAGDLEKLKQITLPRMRRFPCLECS